MLDDLRRVEKIQGLINDIITELFSIDSEDVLIDVYVEMIKFDMRNSLRLRVGELHNAITKKIREGRYV